MKSDPKISISIDDTFFFNQVVMPSSYIIDGCHYWTDSSLTTSEPGRGCQTLVKVDVKESDSMGKIQRRIKRKLKEIENPPHFVWPDPSIARPDTLKTRRKYKR